MDHKEKQLEKLKLKMLAECDKCNHTGVLEDKSVCNCLKKFYFFSQLAYANIGKEYWNLSLKDFKTGDMKAKFITEKYCKNLDSAYDNGLGIMFMGSSGTGKTFLAVEILKAALNLGYSIYFISLSEILKCIKDGFEDKTKKEIFENKIKDVDFLVIDDVKDYDSSTPFALMEFEALMRYRCQNNLPTIITTNLSLEETKHVYSESLLSIFTSKMKIVEVVGVDYRKKLGDSWDKILSQG